MQVVDATVRLSGDIAFAVEKQGLTVAEVALLRAMHGQDAIVNVRPTHKNRISPAQEKARLQEIYGGSTMTANAGDLPNGPGRLIEKLFPGMNPRMPNTLADIGLEAEANSAVQEIRARGAKRAEVELPPEADDADDADGNGDDE